MLSRHKHFLLMQTSPKLELQICKGEEPQSLLNSLETFQELYNKKSLKLSKASNYYLYSLYHIF